MFYAMLDQDNICILKNLYYKLRKFHSGTKVVSDENFENTSALPTFPNFAGMAVQKVADVRFYWILWLH